MTLNNQEARIMVGVKDAYITSTTSQGSSGQTVTSQSVNFVETGLKLNVTPTVSRDGFISMKIKPEISSATTTDIKSEGQITQIPIVTTSEAETTVMVKDGITIVIGGLKKDKRVKTVKKIPLFGDIPGLGFFFRSTSDEVTKTELVILLTPHIIGGDISYTDFSELKPKEGVVVSMEAGRIVTENISSETKAQTDQLLFSGYYQAIVDKVRQLSLLSYNGKEKGKVDAVFTISFDGSLSDEPQVSSSSNSDLNQAVIEAIKSAAPFAPFPKGLNKKEETFHIALEYK
jgi:TonB family protein